MKRQDKAGRSAKLLVVCIAMTVLCIIASVFARSRRRESADGQTVSEHILADTCDQPIRELAFAAT